MKRSYVSSITLALSVLVCGYAAASERNDHGYRLTEVDSTASLVLTKTRAEVLAELAEAQRTGDISVNVGNRGPGVKLNELYPTQYPAKSYVQGKTRADVLAELAEAQSKGETMAIIGNGHPGK